MDGMSDDLSVSIIKYDATPPHTNHIMGTLVNTGRPDSQLLTIRVLH